MTLALGLSLLGCRSPQSALPPLDQPLPCAPGCAREERARQAVARAVPWLREATASPQVPINADVLLATLPILARFQSEPLQALVASVRDRADPPGDPRHRLFDPSARLPEPPGARFEATPGADLHPNQPLLEVLYCPEHGLRSSTIRWLCEDFRDQGGPRSGHAAWYLSLAVGAGCVAREATCLDALAEELRQAALVEPMPSSTEQVDRLAEQLLFSLLAGTPPEGLEPAVDRLLSLQQSDGRFGTGERTLDRVQLHATLVSAWSLTEWIALQQPSLSATSPDAPGAPAPVPPAPPAPRP